MYARAQDLARFQASRFRSSRARSDKTARWRPLIDRLLLARSPRPQLRLKAS